jgi:hypothetical protein
LHPETVLLENDSAGPVRNCGFAAAPPLSRRTGFFRIRPEIAHPGDAPGLLSPSRHIYKPLTIAVAFRRLGAFDRVWQHPIKVDGTFA